VRVADIVQRTSLRDRSQSVAIPYGAVALTLLLVGVVALRRHGLIALGDVWPGYAIPGNRHLADAFSLWTTSLTGFGSAYFAPDLVLPSLFCGSLALVGLSPATQQLAFYVALLVFEGLGTAYFVRGLFPERPIIALIAGIALPLSLYNAVVFLNYVDAFAIGFFPYSAGWLVRRLREPVPPMRLAAECGLLSPGVMMLAGTPPIAAYFLLWVAGCTVTSWIVWRTFRATVGGLALGVLLALAINGWWAYQVFVTLSGGAAVSAAFAGPLEWSWVDRRASVLNLLSMKAIWSIDKSEYAPWFWIYERTPLQQLVFAPAFLALMSILSPYRRRVALLFGIVAASAFLAKGYHQPFAGTNAFLYENLPFFWLFRDPQVEANITLYLAMFALAAVGLVEAVSRLARAFGNAPESTRRVVQRAGAATLFAALLASGAVLVAGAAVPNEWLNGQARTVINIPQYWYDAAAYLNARVGTERVLVLPNDDFYAMGYEWGYYGADGPPRSLIHVPVIMLAPGAYDYVAQSLAARGLLRGILESIQSRPNVAIAPALCMAGIGWILQRNDINTTIEFHHIVPAPQIAGFLSRQPGIRKVAGFGKLDVYRVAGPEGLVAAYEGSSSWRSPNPPDLVRSGAILNGDATWLGALAERTATPSAIGFLIDTSESAQPYTLERAGTAWLAPPAVAAVSLQAASGRLHARLAGAATVSNGTPLVWRRDIAIPIVPHARGEVAVRVSDRYQLLASERIARGERLDLGLQPLASDDPLGVTLYTLGPNALAGVPWELIPDCRLPVSEALSMPASAQLGAGLVRLRTGSGSACARVVSRAPFERGDTLFAELDYRNVAGAEPAISIVSPPALVNDDDLLFGASWHRWNHIFKGTRSRAALVAFAFKTSPRVSANEYARASIRRMDEAESASVATPDTIAPVAAGVIRPQPASFGPNLLRDATFQRGLWNPLVDDTARQALEARRAERSFVSRSGVLELRANGSHVSERQTIAGVAGSMVRVNLEARALRGQPPVAQLIGEDGQILWQSGFRASSDWQSAQADVYVGSGNDEAAYVLTAAADYAPSVAQFRHLSLRAWSGPSSRTVVVSGVAPRALPARWVERGDEIDATVPAGTRVLVLRNSFSEGWRVAEAGRNMHWDHVAVDGIFNGWIVPPGSEREITLYFEPNIVFRRLQALAVVGIALCFGLLGIIALRSRG